jgi:hypothetical protein
LFMSGQRHIIRNELVKTLKLGLAFLSGFHTRIRVFMSTCFADGWQLDECWWQFWIMLLWKL